MSELYFNDVQKSEQFNKMNRDVTKKIKQERLQAKLTEQDLADMLGVSRGTFRALENGSKIDFALLLKYGEKFGIDVNVFVNFEL